MAVVGQPGASQCQGCGRVLPDGEPRLCSGLLLCFPGAFPETAWSEFCAFPKPSLRCRFESGGSSQPVVRLRLRAAGFCVPLPSLAAGVVGGPSRAKGTRQEGLLPLPCAVSLNRPPCGPYVAVSYFLSSVFQRLPRQSQGFGEVLLPSRGHSLLLRVTTWQARLSLSCDVAVVVLSSARCRRERPRPPVTRASSQFGGGGARGPLSRVLFVPTRAKAGLSAPAVRMTPP